jgi:hypothetical protein
MRPRGGFIQGARGRSKVNQNPAPPDFAAVVGVGEVGVDADPVVGAGGLLVVVPPLLDPHAAAPTPITPTHTIGAKRRRILFPAMVPIRVK